MRSCSYERDTRCPGRCCDPNLPTSFCERHSRFSTGKLQTLSLNNPGGNSYLLRRANMCSQCRVSKHCGYLCVPPTLPLEAYRSQTRTASTRCPHGNWRSRVVRPSIETIACVLTPTTSIHQRREWIGRRTQTQPSRKSSSSPTPPRMRAGVSSRFRRAFGA